MKVNYDQILDEIKNPALVFKKVIPYWKISTFKKINFLHKMAKGKCKVDLKYREYFLSNESQTRVCVYEQYDANPNEGVMLYFHGGGYAMGYPEMCEDFYYEIATRLNLKIVAPDYRLSIDHPFPAGLDDCFDTLKWLISQAMSLGIDPNKIIIAGDSAGGGLVCATSILARQEKIQLLAQVPLYPMLDDSMSTESARDNDAPVWNTKSSEVAWSLYLRDSDNISELAAPARTQNYQGLPPTYSFIGDLDPFLDEVVSYFKKLKRAGVKSNLKVFSGCYHGFERTAPKAKVSLEANDFIINELKEILNQTHN